MTISETIFLLIIAALTALIARRLKIPYTVGLIVVGTALTLTHVKTGMGLTRTVLFDGLLPPLLFEAALSLSWREMRKNAAPILTLATVGVVISAAVTALGMMLLAHRPWASAWVFGVLIAATDPVSVLATFKETGVTGRIRMLVEGESLLNDGVAAVLFAVAISMAQSGSHVAAGQIAETFLWQVAGGIGIGVLVGAGATLLASRPNADHLVETALTAVAAYGSFLLADRYHASGVLATVAAGMVMGNLGVANVQGSRFFTERGREVVEAFWEFAAFVVNSLIFLLIGIDNGRIPFGKLGWPLLGAAIALVWISRATTVYPLCALFARSKHRLSRSYQNIMFWGGLRGALALALALSLPRQVVDRNEIIIATFGVVAFSVVVQGIAMPFWLKRWGFMTPPGAEAPESS